MSNAAPWTTTAGNKFREAARSTENPTAKLLAEGLTALTESLGELDGRLEKVEQRKLAYHEADRLVNRRQRRAAGQRGPARRDIGQFVACPDCNSTVTVTQVTDRIYNSTVEHDATCPWFAAFKHSGGFGVRFTRRGDNR